MESKTPDVYLVVPTNRPEMASNIRYNSENQATKHTLVTLDGPGSAASKRNSAIWALQGDSNLICFADDDDYLGPHYLSEVVGNSRIGQLTGKSIGWVHWEPHGELTLHPPKAKWLLAGTLSGYASDWAKLRFREGSGEEVTLCREAKEAGLELKNLGPLHFAYRRRPSGHGHTYSITKEEFYKRHGKPVASIPDAQFYRVDQSSVLSCGLQARA
jgi:hypothetical protein